MVVMNDYNPGNTLRPPVDRAKVIRQYLHIPPYRGVAIWGQPAEQVCCSDRNSACFREKINQNNLHNSEEMMLTVRSSR
jgi:hypothetical protein